ncbi:hypothetical protein [Kordiimonas sp.]|uniref:hypothetical protein n=1 Tax=Kordiimonas sp. TaxID=1970157 RepID=UPI003A8F8615
MTMASLSASLLARKGDARPANRVKEMFVPRSAPQPRSTEARTPETHTPSLPVRATSEKPVQLREHGTSPAPQTSVAARKQKSLRLDLVTDRALRMLAARDGVTQQSLMEAAVKTLINEKSDEAGCVCGQNGAVVRS